MAVKGGGRYPVSFEDVFPAGCRLVAGSIGPVEDFDEKTRARTPAIDKISGLRVYQVRVIDMDPELGTRSRETAVKIAAPHQPVPPSSGDMCEVEFEGMTVTPYVNDRGRLAYSLRAAGMKNPSGAVKPSSKTDAAA